MKKIIIAIDGYSATGKSTTAKTVATRLNYTYIDSGAMYRAVTLYFLDNHTGLTIPNEVKNALESIELDFHYNTVTGNNDICLNQRNVESEIRDMRVTDRVSEVSTFSSVREALVVQQQKMGRKKGIVMDGRDIGSVVFPDAELKVFMTADIKIRAERRQRELLGREIVVDLDEIIKNLEKRDHIDSTRADSPLVKTDDAVEIDTTELTIGEQTDIILEKAIGIIFDKELKNEN